MFLSFEENQVVMIHYCKPLKSVSHEIVVEAELTLHTFIHKCRPSNRGSQSQPNAYILATSSFTVVLLPSTPYSPKITKVCWLRNM